MSTNLVLDESLASASGVLLISNGEIVEFFPRSSNGKDLGLDDEHFVLTEAEEIELKNALEDFVTKIQIIYKKMDETQIEIDKSRAESAKNQKRIDASLARLDEMFIRL